MFTINKDSGETSTRSKKHKKREKFDTKIDRGKKNQNRSHEQ